LRTRAAILFGTPSETVEDMRRSIEFVKDLRPDYALFGITQIFPGTPLFKKLLVEGYVDEDIWRDFMHGRRTSLDYLPSGISFKDIYKINVEAFNHFYLDWNYLKRRMLSVSDFDETGEVLFSLLAKVKIIPIKDVMDDGMHKCIE
jgi:anaerobic magnesium-protoporphyrin IX monomethyl ester cyclase